MRGTTGALTVYGDDPSRFDYEAGAVARVLVQHAAEMVRVTPRRRVGLKSG
jgi:hypothetical protein